jgi:hypothetical protein
MKHAYLQTSIIVLTSACALILSACSVAPLRTEPAIIDTVIERAIAQEQGPFRVRASVPGEDEAEQIFGIPIYDRRIQPIWLEVTNDSDLRARVMLASIDAEYFPPLEVAYMHRKRFSKEGWMDLERYLYRNALPRRVAPGQTVSGFVFTNASQGTKTFNMDIYYATEPPEYEQFTFFIEVPGFQPDHAKVHFQSLYDESEVTYTDIDGLRGLLEDVPCCTTNRDGTAQGRPVQLFFVGSGRDLLRALLRAGWDETSYERDEQYLAQADYLFARTPDAVFRKRRAKSTERAEMGLWLAPVLVDGESLWVAQFRHFIGRRYAIGEMLLGAQLDPDTTDGRNYVLQDIWYSQSLQHWAWSTTGMRVSKDSPELDINGYPWFARDSYRAVIWVSGKPVALTDATPMDWGRVEREIISGSQP